MVEPTSSEETLIILNNIKDKYEEHHNVTYTLMHWKPVSNLPNGM